MNPHIQLFLMALYAYLCIFFHTQMMKLLQLQQMQLLMLLHEREEEDLEPQRKIPRMWMRVSVFHSQSQVTHARQSLVLITLDFTCYVIVI